MESAVLMGEEVGGGPNVNAGNPVPLRVDVAPLIRGALVESPKLNPVAPVGAHKAELAPKLKEVALTTGEQRESSSPNAVPPNVKPEEEMVLATGIFGFDVLQQGHLSTFSLFDTEHKLHFQVASFAANI